MGFPEGGLELDQSITNTEGGGAAVRVPEGEYKLRFKGVACVAENKEKFPYILRAEIVEGPGGKGRVIPTFCYVFAENGGSWFGQAYKSIGGNPDTLLEKFKKVPNYKAYQALGALLSKAMSGKEVGATITDDTYEGKTRSRVAEFYPVSDYAERSKFQTASPNGTGAAEIDPALTADIDELTATL